MKKMNQLQKKGWGMMSLKEKKRNGNRKKGKRSYHRNLERGPAGNRKKMVPYPTLPYSDTKVEKSRAE